MESGEEDLGRILRELYEKETLRKAKTVQFSFATKLIHTINPNRPIFDSKVKERLKDNLMAY